LTEELVIVSGKGGTGKTSLTLAFATLAENVLLVDCDVDASDMHLICKPEIISKTDFYSAKKAVIDYSKCTECGKCAQLCRFDAINAAIEIDEVGCEGCAVCAAFCPEKAIVMQDAHTGEWYISKTRFGKLVHAKLGIAEENSGKLVATVKRAARILAKEEDSQLIIADGPPGIGCPVIASISGANLALIVCEPTESSYQDMVRLSELLDHFRIKTAVCINKYDIVPEMTAKISQFSCSNKIAVIGKIPYNGVFNKAQMVQQSVIEFEQSYVTESIRQAWNNIKSLMEDLRNERKTK